jgi:hypothetical protein
MKRGEFWIAYVLLLVAQLLLSNYFHVTPYIFLTILPVMVLCIPIRMGTVGAMFVAALTGLAVDYLSEGVLGLNALALIPVAFARNGIIGLVFGRELFARKEDFSVERCGFGKVAMALFLSTLLFLVIYIWADGAGTRPLWFNGLRLAASLGASFVVSLLTLGVLAPDPRK